MQGSTSEARYIELSRISQEIIGRQILVDFTKLNLEQALEAANAMKDTLCQLLQAPPSQVENQISRLNEQIVTQAASIGTAQERITELLKEGKDLEQNKANTNEELALTQHRI